MNSQLPPGVIALQQAKELEKYGEDEGYERHDDGGLVLAPQVDLSLRAARPSHDLHHGIGRHAQQEHRARIHEHALYDYLPAVK